jgi:hypothetical protein
MSSGPVGNGLSYWANIRISGQLTPQQLQAVVQQIEAILNGAGVNGKIVTEARLSDQNANPSFQVTYRKA